MSDEAPPAAENADQLSARAMAAAQAKRFDEAEAYFQRAVAARPQDAMLRSCWGAALQELGRPLDAAQQHRHAIAQIAPSLAGIYSNLGNAQAAAGEFTGACESYRMARALHPGLTALGRNWATALIFLGRIEEAIALLEEEIVRRPDYIAVWRNLLLASLYDHRATAADRAALHRRFDTQFPPDPVPSWSPPPLGAPPRRLRIGFVSSDFRDHPVGRNYEPILRHLDRRRFEVCCYALGHKRDAVTETIRSGVDHWRQIIGGSDAQVAEIMRADHIDIAVFIASHFDNNQPLIAQRRPAPVVMNVGDCELGLRGFDYWISDIVVAPRQLVRPHYERPLRVPNFYVHKPLDDAPPMAPPPKEISFIAGHNPSKLNAANLALWGEILRREPEATLSFRYRSAFLDTDLQNRLRSACGEGVARQLKFEEGSPSKNNYLAQYQMGRVSLDPFPFNGATTTFESLWMGVPVVTLMGENLHGRMSASMLGKVGLADCVARSRENYVEIALRLVQDTARLTELRASLRDRVAASPLCDGAKTARWFGRLFQAAWRKWEKS